MGQADHDRASCTKNDADTGAKKRTRIPPGYRTSTCAASPGAGRPILHEALAVRRLPAIPLPPVQQLRI